MRKVLLMVLFLAGLSINASAETKVWICSKKSVDFDSIMGVRSAFPGSDSNITLIVEEDKITVKSRFLVGDEYWSNETVYTNLKHHYDSWYSATSSYAVIEGLYINLKDGRFSQGSLGINSISGSIGQCDI